ncbi:taste receptor type 2 member 31-like [Tupaia chinensis]|uniref:taste receptor type 2 member 31-like n=1 Tax=Tupaia chinensis TaxID=246437 RepID=UPI0003C8D9C3|nr:taste receptor type 2 member 31-like [Tupaia chinensis]XP_006164869.1 taste receptor type 2 member 31-like [Tupaia chinensis]
MMRLLPIIFYTLLMTEFVFGNFANGFIALVNFTDWVKRQKISSADQILTALAISRICLLWVILMHWYIIVFHPDFYTMGLRIIIHNAWTVANHFSIWFATSLSIFYLLKIANFSNLIFLHLKRRVQQVVVMLLLGTLVILFFHLVAVNIHESVNIKECEENMTYKIKLRNFAQMSYVTVFTVANILPFTASLICFLLLICSLCKHLKKMQLYGKEFQDTRFKVHIKSLQTVISFLLLLAIYFISVIIAISNSDRRLTKVNLILWQAIGMTYPACHPIILILGNTKLKQILLSLFWQMRG